MSLDEKQLKAALTAMREKPALAVGAGVTALLFVAILVGLLRGKPDEKTQVQAALAAPAPAEKTTAAAPAAPAAQAAPAAPALEISDAARPAAFSLETPMIEGASDALAQSNDGEAWVSISSAPAAQAAPFLEIDLFSFKDDPNFSAGGWNSEKSYMKVTRKGFIKIPATGTYSFRLLANERKPSLYSRHGICRLNAAGVALEINFEDSQTPKVAAATLAAGFHEAVLSCSTDGVLARAEAQLGAGETPPVAAKLWIQAPAANETKEVK